MQSQLDKLYLTLHQVEKNDWIEHDLFSMQWWIIVGMNIVFFGLFLYFIDRKRIFQISIAFLICFIIAGVFDETGESLDLWFYHYKLAYFAPQFFSADFVTVAVVYAMLYQLCKTWGKFLMWSVVCSLINAFIGLPIYVYLGIAEFEKWNYFYSFLVLIVISILVKCITDFMVKMNFKLKQPEHDNKPSDFSLPRLKKKAR